MNQEQFNEAVSNLASAMIRNYEADLPGFMRPLFTCACLEAACLVAVGSGHRDKIVFKLRQIASLIEEYKAFS